jgi:electron transfer DM13
MMTPARTLSFGLLLVLIFSGCGDSMVSADGPDNEDDAIENDATFRRGLFMATPGIGKMATGTATLNTLAGGNLRVEFSEDFTLTFGPGLFVYLSNAEFPSDDAINLGEFFSAKGAQFYGVPEGVSLESYKYVLVHCIPFDVTFAFARLR